LGPCPDHRSHCHATRCRRRDPWHGRHAQGPVRGRGKGKSGGYRVVTFYTGPDLPVFLITLFSKGEKIDLSQAERNAMRKELADLAEDYRRGVVRHDRSR